MSPALVMLHLLEELLGDSAMNNHEDHVLANFEAFQKLLPSIAATHSGTFALVRDAEVQEYYQTWEDAYRTGKKFYSDGRFSVQEVTSKPVDLGFFSHAIIHG